MKRFFVIIISVVLTLSAYSQNVEITPYGGYLLGGKIRFYEGRLKMMDNVNYGITIGSNPGYGLFVGVDYHFMNSTIKFFPSYGSTYNYDEARYNQHYIQLVANKELDYESFVPYFGFGAGLAIADVLIQNVDAVTKFSGSVQLGAKLMLSENIGLRFQARMLMPMYFAGGGLYAGFGYGGNSLGYSLNTGIIVLQGDFSAGLVIKI